MKIRTFRGRAWISTLVALTFSSSTVFAQSRPVPAPTAAPEVSSVTFVVEHARREDVATLTEQYEKHTGATVVSIVVTQDQANTMGLTGSANRSQMDDTETGQYAQRELAASTLGSFEGGDVVVVVSLGTVLLVVLIVILIVILL